LKTSKLKIATYVGRKLLFIVKTMKEIFVKIVILRYILIILIVINIKFFLVIGGDLLRKEIELLGIEIYIGLNNLTTTDEPEINQYDQNALSQETIHQT
jgi:hypothetical protein